MSISQTPAPPTSTSKLSFRALLPFGPNKTQPTPISPAVSPPIKSPNVFGSFRRSISVTRPSIQPAVIDISSDAKRSVSLSDLQKPLPEPSEEPADLSTIIEADTSGVSLSKHLPSPSPSPAPETLDLSTSRLDAEVLDAMIAKDYATAGAWSADVKVIDVSSDSLDIDPDLAKLLSPNNLSQKNQTVDLTIQPKHIPSPADSPMPSASSVSPNRSKFFTQSSSSLRSRKNSMETGRPPPSPLSSQASDRALRQRLPRIVKGKERERVITPTDFHFPTSRSSLDIPHSFRRASPSPDSRDIHALIDTIPRSNSTPAVATRLRKRSMSVEYSSPSSLLAQQNSTRAFHTVRSRNSPSEPIERPNSSLARKVELGPRTIRAFKAAGLLGDEPSLMRSSTTRAPSRMHSDIVDSPMISPPSGRHSRMTHSEWRSPSVLDSVSPTTHSSRDTPRSASTAPTSVTSTSLSRERDREWLREEYEQLKERHSLETSALLSALSDSQRTTRLLREENEELRERLTLLEREFEERRRTEEAELMDRLGEIERENDRLHRLLNEYQQKSERSTLAPPRFQRQPPISSLRLEDPELEFSPDLDIPQTAGFTSTPAPPESKRQRRLSSSSRASSVFQIPPSEMSLLLHDNLNLDSDRSGLSTVSTSPEDPTIFAPLTLHFPHSESVFVPPPQSRQRHVGNKSISSISSAFTRSSGRASPKSLFPLRPEDEVHLGDLGSILAEDSEGSSVI